VCALIATLFIDALLGTNLRWLVGALFVLAMFALRFAVPVQDGSPLSESDKAAQAGPLSHTLVNR